MSLRSGTTTSLSALTADLHAVLRGALAIVAAALPSGYWPRFSRLPVARAAGPAAMLTAAAGVLTGLHGFLAFSRTAASAIDAAALRAGGVAPGGAEITTLTLQAASISSVVAFTFASPLGWLSLYLLVSGAVRAITVVAGDPAGDPLLSAVDRVVRTMPRLLAWRRARRRIRDEGAETADRLFTGDGLGLAGADLAVVASRRKPDWEPGTTVVTAQGWYLVGIPIDAMFAFGLRTVYPLTRRDTHEVLRRKVFYEFPPLQRGPGRLG